MKRICLILVLVWLANTPAQGTTWTFNVNLNGQEEVPPQNVPISPGIGTALATLDDTNGNMSITGSFSGLTAAANNAHLHGFAADDVAASPLFGLQFTPATSGTFSGNGTVALADVSKVLGGLTYINIHSAGLYAAGEIRGQLVNPIPEPTSIALAGIGLLGAWYIARRRGARKTV
jgi:hypothetical protein